MARSKDDIKALMDAEQSAQASLSALNSPSATADFTLWKNIIAALMNGEEQLWDIKEAELNSIIAKAAPGTAPWIKQKVLEFQYSATNPQILQLINYVPTYPTIDESLRIVTRCSVKTDADKNVLIKVAKSDPPVQLATLEYSSLVGYLSSIMFAGISFNVINLPSDKLYISADVYYDGQYSSNIKSAVETTIEDFLSAIPYDGQVKISDLEQCIKNVTGVIDIKLNTVKARPNAIALGSASIVYDLTTGTNARFWNTISGVIVAETTVGNTLSDTINYYVS